MDADRFWRKASISGPLDCWEWQGYRDRNGYGRLAVDGRMRLAHRIAFRLAKSEPGALFVCHHCDNPPCVNPAHLFLGTAADNAADMRAKGRGLQTVRGAAGPPRQPTHEERARGERDGNAKLTAAQVSEIRRRYVRGVTPQRDIAAAFGITIQNVSYIVRHKTWSHI